MRRAPTAVGKRDHELIFEVVDSVNIVIRFRVSMTENTLLEQSTVLSRENAQQLSRDVSEARRCSSCSIPCCWIHANQWIIECTFWLLRDGGFSVGSSPPPVPICRNFTIRSEAVSMISIIFKF